METKFEKGTAEVVEKIVREHHTPNVIDAKGGQIETQVVFAPSGETAHHLEKFLAPLRMAPRRRAGVSTIETIDSLIDIVNRFKSDDSAIFGQIEPSPKLVAVFNYHPQGFDYEAAHFGDHRAQYSFPLSDEWVAWNDKNEEWFSQGEFAEFIEERILDVSPVAPSAGALLAIAQLLGGSYATPNVLLELSRGLTIYEGSTVKNVVNTATGEAKIQFETTHSTQDGKALDIPKLFAIQVPCFKNGPLYQIAARLRYRKQGGTLLWSYALYREEKVLEAAFDEALERVKVATSTPLYRGEPEKATTPPAL